MDGSMLILTRRPGQTVHIADDIRVTVIAVNGHHVRLGIHAPKHIPVHREEIYKRIQRDKIAVSNGESQANYPQVTRYVDG